MIGFQNVSLQRGGKPLLEQADLLVHSGQRVGVIGANGCGKSSLFQLLLGSLTTDQGVVSLPQQLRIAHMAQEIVENDRSALDYVLDGDVELRQTQSDIREAEAADDHNALAVGYAQLDTIDGHSAESRAQQLLYGLGFAVADAHRKVEEFSGGWRIRLNLAQALMRPSDLLLLDEPTNHLDLDATLWLEQWLIRYQGTLLLISHDRDFLDNVATHIVHFSGHRLNSYKGNYSAYEKQRAERMAQQQAQYRKQQEEIADIHRFVARFRAKATKAKQAQSRLKALARMELIAPAHIGSPFCFRFLEPGKQSDPLIKLEQATLGYDGNPVLEGVNLNIPAGARIGLLGANGAGKSTLIKTLSGDLPLIAGERICGENLDVGYFAQHQLEALDLNASPLLHLQRLSPNASEQSLRNFLGGFDFHGDMATGSIRHFSGGEKARLALAIVVWGKPNLLILDEPTNHLDLEMCHALTVALQGFNGAVVLVSHDRHLLRNSVDEFMLVANGRVEPFKEDLDYYQKWLTENKQAIKTPKVQAVGKQDKKVERRQAAARREQLRPLKNKLKQVEEKIEVNVGQLAKIEARLLEPSLYESTNKDELQSLLLDQGRLIQESERLEQDWFQLTERLEQASALTPNV